MKPSNYLNDLLRRTTPEQAVIKKKAHAATLAAAALIVPSLCAIYFRSAGVRENEPEWVWAALTIWKIHAAVVVAAGLLWVFEKPKLTKYLPVEPIDEDEEAGTGGTDRPGQ